MAERIFEILVRGLQLVVPPVVTTAVVLFVGLDIASRPEQGPQLVVVPQAAACPTAPDPPPCCLEQPPPARRAEAPAPAVIVLEATGVTEWLGVVDARRSELEHLLSGSGLVSSTRILPHETDGQTDGFRVYGIRHGSVLWAVGLRNGDTLHEVNGRPLTSPDAALDLYSSTPSYLDVRLTRRGRPARLLVLLHDDQRPHPPRR